MRMLVLLVILAPVAAHAEVDQKGVRTGGAVMLASVDQEQSQGGPNQDSGLISQPGWFVGAFVTWRRSDNFALQLEGAVVNNRLRVEVCNPSPCMTTKNISLYYLEVPFLLRLDLLPDATKFHLDLGAEAALTLGGGNTPPGGEFERFDDLLPFNVGVVAGLGVEFDAGPGKITVDARYKRWLVPLTGSLTDEDPPSGLGTPEQDVKSSHQVVVGVGYAFP